MATLIWHDSYDEKDRPIWEAASVYCYDEGTPFYWRIVKVRDGCFRLAHDSELMIASERPLRFGTLEAAQSHCQKNDDTTRVEEGIA